MNQQTVLLIAAYGLIAIGAGLLVGGVYVLFGAGCALIAGAVPFFGLAVLMLKGMNRVA